MHTSKAAKIGLTVILALLVIALVAAQLLLNVALKPSALKTHSRNIEASEELLAENYPQTFEWYDSLRTAGALQDLYLDSSDGTRLHALLLPAAERTGKTAVLVHGYTDNALGMMMVAIIYSRQMGYNVLLPDLYAHGLSGGKAIRMGWKDRFDVLRWMEEAVRIFGEDTQLVVHGISMGAATTMCVAGEVDSRPQLLPHVKCFIEDCGYTSVWDEFKGELRERYSLPSFPLLDLADLLCRIEYGWGFKEASPLNQVRKNSLPMMFIHGEADTFVPTWMVYPLHDACSAPSELWTLPGVAHALSCREDPQQYAERVKEFTGRYVTE